MSGKERERERKREGMAVPSDVTGTPSGPRQLCFGDTISLYAEGDDVHGFLSTLGYAERERERESESDRGKQHRERSIGEGS